MLYFTACFTHQIRSWCQVGGTRCNVVMTRLHPWMRLHALRKKKTVVQGESTKSERSHSSDYKAFMWTSTISAPEMTVVLYDLNGSPIYHVRPFYIVSTSFTLLNCLFIGSRLFLFFFKNHLYLCLLNSFQQLMSSQLTRSWWTLLELIIFGYFLCNWGHDALKFHSSLLTMNFCFPANL